MAQMFDEHELLDRVDNDIGFLSETVEMLATDGRALMEQVRQSISSGDAAGLGKTAHTLKGMVSNFASPQTHAGALALEHIGKSGELAGAGVVASQLGDDLESLLAELNKFISARA